MGGERSHAYAQNPINNPIPLGLGQADLVNPPHGSNDPAPVAGSVASGPGQFRNYTADTRYMESDPLRHGLDVKQVGSLRLKPPKISRGFMFFPSTVSVQNLGVYACVIH